ncbi:MAG: hypothetical protein LBH69_05395 [Methanomassiliicoccaceae archaeon]|nr:hypothetical protein [Methanomassiliicoccaceae archaeon]
MATYKQPCNQCGELIDRDSRVCPKCATKNPYGFSCPKCLRTIARGDLACAGCGKTLTVACPLCNGQTFVGSSRCDACGRSLMVMCENKKCGVPQYFDNTKCTACGKAVKDGGKKLMKGKGSA